MKELRKLLVVFCFLSFGNFYVNAQEKVPGIIVELKNGEKLEFRLVDKPKMVFDGTKIALTAEGVSLEYTPSELLKVTTGEVENVSSGIEELNAEQGDIQVNGGFVRLSGFTSEEPVRVYSASGVLKSSFATSSDGSLTISISDLPTGISIIKTNKQSIKITKR